MVSIAAKIALAPLLVAQGVWARRRALVLSEPAGPRSGELANAANGAATLRLLIVGDSSAAGVGVADQDQALSGHLVRELATRSGARIRWQLVARSGVSTEAALDMLRSMPEPPAGADAAVVVTGVNDVVGQVPPQRALEARIAMLAWLQARAGVHHVAFAALPPMHRFPALPQPLRWFVGADARRHDRALRQWAGTRSDASYVPIEMSLGATDMAADGFHPGEPVYRACGEQIAVHLLQRLA